MRQGVGGGGGGLLGWLEWNGFAMVTAGKRKRKEVFWRAATPEHLIRRPCEALGAQMNEGEEATRPVK